MSDGLLQVLAQVDSTGGGGGAGLAIGGGLIGCVFFLIAIVAFAFWVWMLIDAVQRDFGEGSEKIVWILVLVFTGIIGALIYFFAGRSRGTKSGGVAPPAA